MEDNKKYSIWILVLFALGAIFTVIWGLYLNKGELRVESKAPYTISILSGATKDCEQDTCTLTLKPGRKILSIFKEGYEEFQAEIDVPRLEEVELKAKLKFIPQIVELKEEPNLPSAPTNAFKLDFDHKQGQQAIFDEHGKVISYFPRQLEESRLFVSPDESYIAVVENTGSKGKIYLLDVKNFKRSEIFGEDGEVSAIKFSPASSKMIITLKREDNLQNYLFKENKLHKLNYADPIDKFAWLNENSFIVATQEVVLDAKTASQIRDRNEISFEDYFALVRGEEPKNSVSKESIVYFHLFNTENFSAEQLSTLRGGDTLPLKLDVLADGKIIFTAENAKHYEILLEQK